MANHHGGLIDPSKFPARAVDLDVARIEQSAVDLARVGRAIEDGTVQIDASWARLTGCYSAPEQEQVYGLVTPAVVSAGSVRSALVRASGHLDTYASALAALKPRLAALEKRAVAFRATVADGVWVDASSASSASFGDHLAWAFDWVPGVDERRVKVPWYEDEHTVAKNGDLLDEYAGLLAEISSAASGCATAVNALVSGVHLDAVEPIPAAAFTATDGDPMPWGSPGIEDRNCRESVGHGGYEFGKSLVQGVGALVLGYNPETGDYFDHSTYGQTWTGFGDLVGSLALLGNPAVMLLAAGTPAAARLGWTSAPLMSFMSDRAATVQTAGGALIGYDASAEDGWHQWREDRWATGTEAVLNVGTFFIPGAGEAGGALKGASVAVKVARLSDAAADFAVQGSSWVVRGGVRVVTGLRDALVHVHLDDLASTVRAGEVVDAGTLGTRLNPTALVHALDDASASPQVTVGPSEATKLDASQARADVVGTADSPAIAPLDGIHGDGALHEPETEDHSESDSGSNVRLDDGDPERVAGTEQSANDLPSSEPFPDLPPPVSIQLSRVDGAILSAFDPTTPRSGATFWSGQVVVDGEVVHDAAMNGARALAERTYGTTLEQTLEQQGLADRMPTDWNDVRTPETWRAISTELAQHASGDVRAFLGDVRPGSVWNLYEFPTLVRNPHITSITVIDAATGEVRNVYRR